MNLCNIYHLVSNFFTVTGSYPTNNLMDHPFSDVLKGLFNVSATTFRICFFLSLLF